LFSCAVSPFPHSRRESPKEERERRQEGEPEKRGLKEEQERNPPSWSLYPSSSFSLASNVVVEKPFRFVVLVVARNKRGKEKERERSAYQITD
jgi:hypothetical protein